MGSRLRRLILDWMRVPHEPDPPEGSPDSIRIFRAGRNYYRWKLALWVAANVGATVGILVGHSLRIPLIRLAPPMVRFGLNTFEVLAIAAFVLSLPLTFYRQRLDYEMRWYIVTDRSLRIRSGIWNVAELTMTFANIQDLRVTAGPLQGLFKLADVEVRSAGGGSEKEAHAAYFEGVDNAEAIRDLVVERLRKYRDAGLGDSDSRGEHVESAGAATALEAARGVLSEVRALGVALARK